MNKINADIPVKMRFDQIAKEEGLSYADLAQELECGSPYAVSMRKNRIYPSLEIMMKFVKKRQLNLSYMLCRTDISDPCSTYEPANRLREIKNRRKYKSSDLAAACNINIQTLRLYEKKRNELYGNINRWIQFSNILEVSVDYLLGFTDQEQWDDYWDNPIFKVKNGDAGYLKSRHFEGYFLLSDNGRWVYFSDGTKMESASMEFRDAEVIKLEKEE